MKTGASRVVVDCPGCVMQIKGGMEKTGEKVKVQQWPSNFWQKI